MHFNDVSADQVFGDFAKIMQEQGHLDKQATYSLPDFVVGEDNYSEVEISGTLKRLANEKLYDLASEDVVSGAHPEGNTKIVDAPEQLGEVETIQTAQKKIHDIAEKKVKLAQMVVAFSDELDKDGFSGLSKMLDEKLAALFNTELPKKEAGSAVEQLIVQLSELVAGAFTESNMLTDHYRDQLNNELAELSMAPSAAGLREFPKQYYKFLEHLWSRPEGKAVAHNMYAIYKDVMDLSNQAIAAMDAPHDEPAPHSEEQGVAKPE